MCELNTHAAESLYEFRPQYSSALSCRIWSHEDLLSRKRIGIWFRTSNTESGSWYLKLALPHPFLVLQILDDGFSEEEAWVGQIYGLLDSAVDSRWFQQVPTSMRSRLSMCRCQTSFRGIDSINQTDRMHV
jgi:hypothetical protein